MTESSLTTVSPGSCTDLLGPLVEWVLAEMFIWIWASLISLRLFRVSLMLQEWARTTPGKMRTSLSACHNTTEVSKERSKSLICWWKSLCMANDIQFLLSRHLLKFLVSLDKSLYVFLCFCFCYSAFMASTCGFFFFTFKHVMAIIQLMADTQKLINFQAISLWADERAQVGYYSMVEAFTDLVPIGILGGESFWRGSRIG